VNFRSTLFLLVGSAAASTLALIACSSDDPPAVAATPDAGTPDTSSEDGGSTLTPTLTTFCEKTYGSFKVYLSTCCNDTDRATEQYGAVSPIFTRISDDCPKALGAAAESQRIEYDASEAQKCIDEFAPLRQASFCQNGTSGNYQVACRGTIRGLQVAGGACRADFECVDGLWCKDATDNAEGTCAAPVAIGTSCVSTGTAEASATYAFGAHPHCASGAYCPAGAAAKCAAASPSGATCTVAAECATGHCYLGKCGLEGPLGEGEACIAPVDCVRGSYCEPGDGGTGTCQERVSAGAVCSADDRRCRGFCKIEGAATSGTCASFCGSG
jgi:hypothetical protein